MQNKELTEKSRLSKKECSFLILSAVLIITIASTCSPLFPLNPWDDANCFLTMGRGILKGLVPYRDLYEQKGPVLYLVHALCALVPGRSFTGVWILESVMASIFAVYSWKSVKLFVKPSKVSIGLVPLFLSVIYTMRLFNFGDSAEELCFPLLSIVLFYALKAVTTEHNLPELKEAFICGIIAGLLLWTKYTFTAFIGAYCLLIIVYSVIYREFRKLFSLIGLFIAGAAVATLPVLLYFGINKALGDMFNAYFYNNMFLYNAGSYKTGILSIPVIKNIAIPFMVLYRLGTEYITIGILLILLIAGSLVFVRKYRLRAVVLFAVTFVITAMATFPRPYYIYYYVLIFMFYLPFILFMFIRAVNFLETKLKDNQRLISIFIGAVCAVTVAVMLLLSKNNYLILKPAKDIPQFKFAEEINKTENPKILTFDIMDAGFYTAAGIVPSNRFFCFLNIEKDWPEILNEQNRLINEGYYDYIVCYDDSYKWDKYELYRVEETPVCDFSGKLATDRFCLYKLKSKT